jgi:cell division protein FtsW
MMAIVACLACFGMVMIYSATSSQAVVNGTSPFGIVEKQVLFALMGVGAFLVCRKWDPKYLHRIAGMAMMISVVALVAVLIPGIGTQVNGARRWIHLPVLGQLQPSEFAKLALVLWIAAAVARNPRSVMTFGGLLPYLIGTLVTAGLVVREPDLGTATTLVLIAFAMLLIAGARSRHLVAVLGLIMALGAVLVAVTPYERARLTTFLNPWSQATGNGFQNVQAQIAVGSGGWHGVGIGAGFQKAFYLPEAHTDMILASIGEELGFFGIVAVLAGLTVVVLLAFRIAMNARDLHQRLIATGLASLIAVQALANAAATLGLMPITGVPLPFVSYGGSSLIVLFASMGLLYSISERTQHAESSAKNTTERLDRSQRDGRARDAGARSRRSTARARG